jgi:hypothetical protein
MIPKAMPPSVRGLNEVIKPIHDDFNAFLAECNEAPLQARRVLRGIALS